MRRRMNIWPCIFILPFLVFFLAFNLFPIISTFVLSFTDWDGLTEMTVAGFSNYVRTLTVDTNVLLSIGHTLILILLLSVPLTVFLTLVITYVYSFSLKRSKKLYQVTSLMPYFTSTVAVGIVFSLMFDRNIGVVNYFLSSLGVSENLNWLGDKYLALITIVLLNLWSFSGYTSIFYIAGMTNIDYEIMESAKIDGASNIRAFFPICIPMMKNVTFFVVMTAVIGGLQQFEQELMLFTGAFENSMQVGGPDKIGLTMVLNYYQTAFKSLQFGYGCSIGVITMAIVGVFGIIFGKILKRGITIEVKAWKMDRPNLCPHLCFSVCISFLYVACSKYLQHGGNLQKCYAVVWSLSCPKFCEGFIQYRFSVLFCQFPVCGCF